MNVSPLLGSLKTLLTANKYVTGAAMGGVTGASRTAAEWKHFPQAFKAARHNLLTFNVNVASKIPKGSVLDEQELVKLLQEQYPNGRVFLKDFTIKYNPTTKNITFEPTELFLEECLKDPNLAVSMKSKVQTLVANVVGFAAISTAITAVGDGGLKLYHKIEEHLKNNSQKIAGALIAGLQKTAVTEELDEIVKDIPLIYIFKDHVSR